MLGRLFGKSSASAGADARAPSYRARYESTFAPLLGIRAESFGLMLGLLEDTCRTLDRPALIVETGSVRRAGAWENEGQSTCLWADFADHYEAEIHTVDLDPGPARVIREELKLGPAVRAHTGDSVRFLHDFAQREAGRHIDLLYLDSFDFDLSNPFPSAFHHMKELAAIRTCLGPGTIVAVDDNPQVEGGGYTGKALLVAEWFDQVGIPRIFTGYQFIWRF